MRPALSRLCLVCCCFLITALPACSQEFFLFGGANHKVFLGSLSASKFHKDSILNQFGSFGNPYSATSIWNDYCPYGGEFSIHSPFNEFSAGSNPPVVVDDSGKFYGYFTANRYHPKRTRLKFLVTLLDNHQTIRQNLDALRDELP